MVSYWRLKHAFDDLPEAERGKRLAATADGLIRLRSMIRDKIPARRTSETLLLGTWNIRNFDDNRFGHGPRLPESFFYLAEMLSAFDIVAVQEICDDLTPFRRLMDALGPSHDFIITDVTLGPGGNQERLGFLYDRNKVEFSGVAGELVLPFSDQISDGTKERQFARTPFACTFQAGWFKFNFATVHIYFGEESKTSPEFARRVKEIDSIAKYTARRAKADKSQAHILVGDFNIVDFDDKTYDALEKHGFRVFRNKLGSNLEQTKFFDQISFMPDPERVVLASAEEGRSHGVFNPYLAIFRAEDFELFDPTILALTEARKLASEAEIAALVEKLAEPGLSAAARKRTEKKLNGAQASLALQEARLADPELRKDYYLEDWRTFQISDHFPLFVELRIDFSEAYLSRLKEGAV